MNLPLTSATGLTFESGHTGRPEKRGVPFFIRGGVLPSFLQKCALIHTFVCLCDLRCLLRLRRDGASPILQDTKKPALSRSFAKQVSVGSCS